MTPPVTSRSRRATRARPTRAWVPLARRQLLHEPLKLERAEPILYVSVVIGRERSAFAYLIGYRTAGGRWEMAEGRSHPRPGEIVIDERSAQRLGVGVGGRVEALGQDLRVAGLASGTANVVASVAFVDMEAFRRAARARDSASYVLVWPRSRIGAGGAARAIERDYPQTGSRASVRSLLNSPAWRSTPNGRRPTRSSTASTTGSARAAAVTSSSRGDPSRHSARSSQGSSRR